MAYSKLKCRGCGNRFLRETMINLNGGNFHDIECAVSYSRKPKQQDKGAKIIDSAWKAQTIKRREEARKREGSKGHYEALKSALHMYIKHVLRRGQPCYTCDLEQKHGDNPQNFHVGHFMPAKMVDPRRFMLANLRIQCNSCNVHNSGRQKEYRIRLIEEMGLEHVEWLECEANHEELKVQYPDVEGIKKEAARYRRMYREGMEQLQLEAPTV